MTETDFLLFTDGSGHEDGFGGWAAVALHKSTGKLHEAYGCESRTSTDRMEWAGLLAGLEMCRSLAVTDYRLLIPGKPRIVWYNDRESVVKYVQSVHGYNSSKDLLARYHSLAATVELTAQHVKIEQDIPAFTFVDLHASSLRIAIKDYVQSVSRFQGSLPAAL